MAEEKSKWEEAVGKALLDRKFTLWFLLGGGAAFSVSLALLFSPEMLTHADVAKAAAIIMSAVSIVAFVLWRRFDKYVQLLEMPNGQFVFKKIVSWRRLTRPDRNGLSTWAWMNTWNERHLLVPLFKGGLARFTSCAGAKKRDPFCFFPWNVRVLQVDEEPFFLWQHLLGSRFKVTLDRLVLVIGAFETPQLAPIAMGGFDGIPLVAKEISAAIDASQKALSNSQTALEEAKRDLATEKNAREELGEELRATNRDYDDLRAETEEARRNLSIAVEALCTAFVGINETRRFKHAKGPTNSSEAAAIAARIAQTLDALLGQDSPERIGDGTLAKALADIAKAKAQKPGAPAESVAPATPAPVSPAPATPSAS